MPRIELLAPMPAAKVRLSVKVLYAEFPCFDLLSAFGAFNLSKAVAMQDKAEDQTKESISRIAQVFNLSEQELYIEFMDHFPVAQGFTTRAAAASRPGVLLFP